MSVRFRGRSFGFTIEGEVSIRFIEVSDISRFCSVRRFWCGGTWEVREIESFDVGKFKACLLVVTD